MLDVCVLSYRDWATDVVSVIRSHPKIGKCDHFTSNKEFEDAMYMRSLNSENIPDLVIYVGWSSEPLRHWVDRIPHVGVHCAESDLYSAGTPLQNQINDGITRTKHRIFLASSPELSLRKWSHEIELDLSGGMDDILNQMTSTSISLFNVFLNDYPNITWKTWPAVDQKDFKKKRTPDDSRLTKDVITKMTTRQLYNFFRCLEEPYPNGYIEDEFGRLYIKKVEFKEK